jgi:biopolymer transport protein ExbB
VHTATPEVHVFAAISLVQLLGQAGWTMIPLYACSVIGLAVLVHKLIEFQLRRVGRIDALSDTAGDWSPADLPDLAARWAADASPLGRVLAVAATGASTHPAVAEREASRAATLELDRFERWIPLLAFIAQVAPLFGLLGTVIGMVDLFGSMEASASSVDTATLSSGIWKALLTTAAGLIIAIPALGGHAWFTRRLDVLQRAMEIGVGRILDRGAV